MIELSSVGTGTVSRAAAPTTLKPVIDILPEAVYDNPTWRGMAYFWRDVAMYVALLVVLVVISNVFAVVALEVVMGLVVSGAVRRRARRRPRRPVLLQAHELDRGSHRHAAQLPRLRGLDPRSQPRAPPLHGPPGLRLRLAPHDTRSSSPTSAGGVGRCTGSSGRGSAVARTTSTRCGGRR